MVGHPLRANTAVDTTRGDHMVGHPLRANTAVDTTRGDHMVGHPLRANTAESMASKVCSPTLYLLQEGPVLL